MSEENLIGKRFTQYEIEEEIGGGRTSTVYRALQTSVNRPVAIKMFPPQMAKQPGFLERFQREMKGLAALEHFNIQSIYGVGVEDGIPFIVMRYLSGGSLADVLKRQRRLPPAVAVALSDQMAAALDYAHAQGVIHRDLKPSNILFDERGNAYVSDFGLSWLLAAAGSTTGTGDLGAPAYMSPEVAAGAQDVTPAIDIYAMGVILFEALTGQTPFTGSNVIQLARMHLNEPPPSARSLNHNLPPVVDAVLHKALAKRPEDRYATAGELATDLAAACGVDAELVTTVSFDGLLSAAESDTLPFTEEEAAEIKRSGRRANEWLVFSVIATLLVLGIVVVGGFLLSQIGAQNAGTPTPPEVAETQPPVEETGLPTEPPADTSTEQAGGPTPRPISDAPGGGGGKIAYVSMRSGNAEVYILDLVSNALTQVTHNTGRNSLLAWSSDGQWLAYVSDQGKDSPHVFVVGADGQNPRDVTPADRAEGYPLWVPGTQTVAYYVLQGEDRVLRTVDANGGEARDVTTVPSSFITLLDWLPNNHVIYYGYSRSGNLAVVDVDTANIERTPVTVSGNIPFLSYSPDRTMVAFTLTQGRQSQLFLADASCPLLDQCNARRLVTDEFNYYTPRFSPDGRQIMTASDRGGNFDLWLIDVDGTIKAKIAGSGLDDYEGVWQP